MHVKEAVIAFSQSEKLKSGLIWANQIVELYIGLPESEKTGAERVLKTLINMVATEIHVAKQTAPHAIWQEAEKDIDTALVMMNSGITHESGYHLTRALTRVTTVGQQSMTVLTEKGVM